MAIFDEKIEIGERCKGVHCVDLGERCEYLDTGIVYVCVGHCLVDACTGLHPGLPGNV